MPVKNSSEDTLPATLAGIGFDKVASFDELYALIREMGTIPGTKKSYSPEELIDIMTLIRRGDCPPNFMPRTLGLREVVNHLLKNDPEYQDRTGKIE